MMRRSRGCVTGPPCWLILRSRGVTTDDAGRFCGRWGDRGSLPAVLGRSATVTSPRCIAGHPHPGRKDRSLPEQPSLAAAAELSPSASSG